MSITQVCDLAQPGVSEHSIDLKIESCARAGRRPDKCVLKKLYPASSLLASDLASFRRQESIFIVLNLLLLAVLLFLHWFFASFWGNFSRALVVAIGMVFLLKGLELIWMQRLSQPLPPTTLAALTWIPSF